MTDDAPTGTPKDPSPQKTTAQKKPAPRVMGANPVAKPAGGGQKPKGQGQKAGGNQNKAAGKPGKQGDQNAKNAQGNNPVKAKPAAKQGNGKQGNGKQNQKQVAKSASPAPVSLPKKGTSTKFRTRLRHFMIMLTFLIFVVAPSAVVYTYLTTRAADQYASTVGFVVRQADSASAAGAGLLGSLTSLGGSTSSDSDILYEFIKSQQIVELIDENLNIREIYNRPDNDPVFTLGEDASIEHLMWYWSWAVNVFYDPGTGLIELRVLAFTPEDAQKVAQEISKQSDALINELSAVSREDTTRYAREELDKAVERLRETRQTLTAFRNSSQIVDPTADVQGRMGLLNYLQQQLADTMIEQDLLRDQARDNDPRLQQSQRRIAVIQERIDEERQKIGLGDTGTGQAAAELVGKYEGLIVDREFAEQAYVKALSNFDGALAEANRTSRYLAEYIKPTVSQEAQYPQRYLIVAILALFLFLTWFIIILIYYSIKDRR